MPQIIPHFLCLNLIPLSITISKNVTRFCRRKKKNMTLRNFVYRGSQTHREPVKQWRYTVLRVQKSHTQKAEDSCRTPIRES